MILKDKERQSSQSMNGAQLLCSSSVRTSNIQFNDGVLSELRIIFD